MADMLRRSLIDRTKRKSHPKDGFFLLCAFYPSVTACAVPAPRPGSLFGVRYKLGIQCRTPSRSDRFNGVTGGAGGPKGRNRNLPWPPCKKGYKEAPFSSVYLNPSVTACAVPAPRPGSLLGATTNQKLFPQVGKVSRLTPPAPPYKSSASCTGFSSGDRVSVPV